MAFEWQALYGGSESVIPCEYAAQQQSQWRDGNRIICQDFQRRFSNFSLALTTPYYALKHKSQ